MYKTLTFIALVIMVFFVHVCIVKCERAELTF